MRVTELNEKALLTAIEEYKNSTYYRWYNKETSLINDIEDNMVNFAEDGHIFGEYRICSHCNNDMITGYLFWDGTEYYCSDECLHKHYTHEQYMKLVEDDNAYWTEWI